MHGGHDHPHDHGAGGHSHGHSHAGHNHGHGPARIAQWQTPHLPEPPPEEPHVHEEPDLDLVEQAFVEGFASATDPTSFLRLARVPFDAVDEAGTRVSLLRVESNATTDIGAVMPHLGGGSFRYDPLPKAMVSRRQQLRFVYFDGKGLRPLPLSEVRKLTEV